MVLTEHLTGVQAFITERDGALRIGRHSSFIPYPAPASAPQKNQGFFRTTRGILSLHLFT